MTSASGRSEVSKKTGLFGEAFPETGAYIRTSRIFLAIALRINPPKLSFQAQ
jgi:hypothetical protein